MRMYEFPHILLQKKCLSHGSGGDKASEMSSPPSKVMVFTRPVTG